MQDTYPSQDGRVRKVKVRLTDSYLDKNGVRTKAQSALERPIHKCMLLATRGFHRREAFKEWKAVRDMQYTCFFTSLFVLHELILIA